MAAILAGLAERDMEFTRLAVSQASHSPLMAEVAAELREALAGIAFTEPAITFVSAVSGEAVRRGDMSADYWVRHLSEPVNFLAAMRMLGRRGKYLFIEVGPFATLTSLGKRCLPGSKHAWLNSLHPSDQDGTVLLEAAAKAYAAGQPISWPDFHHGRGGRKIELPTYAFDRRSYRLPITPGGPSPAVTPGAASGRGGRDDPGGQPAGQQDALAATAAPTPPPGEDGCEATITELIRAKAAAVLEFPDLADVGADADLTDLGMDSLLAVKLRKELCASLSITFPTPEIFNNPTPRALAEFLEGHIEGHIEKVG